METEENPDVFKRSEALAFPPSWTEGWNWIWRQPFLFQRGSLALDPEELVYQAGGATLTIPLDRIEDVCPVGISFARDPLGRCPVKVRWKDPAGRVQKTCFLIGFKSWLTSLKSEQANTDQWLTSLREGIDVSSTRPTWPEVPQCSDVTPETPRLPAWGWVLLVVGGVLLTTGLPFLLILWVFYGAGLWRRREEGASQFSEEVPATESAEPSDVTSDGGASLGSLWARTKMGAKRAGAATSSKLAGAGQATANWMKPREGAYSKLALTAFGLATLGWIIPVVGPVIGCVLGWIALFKMRNAETPLKGRGIALFAALLVPALIILGGLGGGLVALGEFRPDLASSPVTVLILVGTVFLALRVVFRLAGCRGRWAWNKIAGLVVVLLRTGVLLGSVWMLHGPQDGWAVDETAFAMDDHQWRSPDEFSEFLDLRDDEWRVLLAYIGGLAGLLFALSGLISGGVSLAGASTLSILYLSYSFGPSSRELMDLFQNF